MRRKTLVLSATSLLALALLWACGGGGTNCVPGYESCPCSVEPPACQAGLSCISNTCVDPNSQSGSGGNASGGGTGVDLQQCTACWDAQCGTQRDACDAASPCGDVAECVMGCLSSGDFTECPASCSQDAANAGQEAMQAYTDLWTCVGTSCVEECFTVPDTGTGGADGTGGMISFLPPTRELRPLDGWVHPEENTLGIQGEIYTYRDFDSNVQGSTIFPDSFAGEGRTFCVSGTADIVPCDSLGDCDHDSYWGAGAGMNLNQAPDSLPQPFNATAAGVTGFSFNITGTVPAGALVFKATVAGDPSDYCIYIPSGSNSVLLSSLQQDCWADIPGPAPDASQIEAIQWQVSTSDLQYRPFDFCIDNVTALP